MHERSAWLDSDFDSDRGEERYGIGYSAQPRDIHHSRIHRSPRLRICCLSVERHLEIVNRNTRGGLLFGSWSLCHRRFVFVENIHCRVFLHVVIVVQMFLKLVVRVEGPFNVLHSTDKAQNLVLHQRGPRYLLTSLAGRGIKRELGPRSTSSPRESDP